LDRKIGYAPAHFRSILAKTRIHVSTSTLVTDVYETYQGRRPERSGVAKHFARQARARAAANRWPTPGYWADRMDAIDDPHFIPEYGVTRREIIAQEAAWIIRTTGVDRQTAAQRLGTSKAYVDHALSRHPQPAMEAAA
ncbi:hypothetical protein, partial [Streptomyces sp. NPDC006610]|uniref:hypothetical protein n=1 Tax=Streptomyces sp. NPDC006610 TaxID=3154584 RepID=UPI0033B5FFB5